MKINEIFKTIQGEATFTGTPSIFIRTQGCPVWCSWCDTKFTWHKGKKSQLVSSDLIIEKDGQDERFCELSDKQILDICNSYGIKHIVITGGEPCINNLESITNLLIQNNFSVQIETSCTQEIKCHNKVWITGSPKIQMAGNQQLNNQAIDRCNEIKFPINCQNDVNNLLNIIDLYKISNKKIWLQPVEINNNKENSLELCIKTCYQYNFNLSVQVHKYIMIK